MRKATMSSLVLVVAGNCGLLGFTLVKVARAEDGTVSTSSQSTATIADNGGGGKPVEVPAIHHAPVSVAHPHVPLAIRVVVDHPQYLRSGWVVYRTPERQVGQVPLQRGSDEAHVATIPADQLVGPWIAYAIEMQDTRGNRYSAFASRDNMQLVQVPDDLDDLREKAIARRLEGRRSVASLSAEYAYFGQTSEMVTTSENGSLHPETVRDGYYRVEGGYTYRPWRTVAEFGLRVGVLRGSSVVAGETDRSKYGVGLNYGAPTVRFRLDDSVHLEAELFTSITEVGFSTGAGGSILLGDPYGSKLTLGAESIERFGTRFYSRMDIQATRRLQVAPIIEVTDMPHADRFGVRLLTEVRYDVGAGMQLGIRGGYQARVSTQGGPSAAMILGYAF